MKSWFAPLSPRAQVVAALLSIVAVIGATFLTARSNATRPLPAYSIPCELADTGETVVVTLKGPHGPLVIQPSPAPGACDDCMATCPDGETRQVRIEVAYVDEEMTAQLPGARAESSHER